MDTELPLPGDNAPLQFQLSVDPRLRQRSVPGVDIGHAVPGQVGRPGEIAAYRLVVQPETPPDTLPDGLLSRSRQRHRDAIQSHPVDKMFPFVPLPPVERITVGAIIQEKAVFNPCLTLDTPLHDRKPLRLVDLVTPVPRHRDTAIFTQVAVQSESHRDRRIAGDLQLSAVHFKHEPVPVGRNMDKPDAGTQPRQDTPGQCRGSLHFGRSGRFGGRDGANRKKRNRRNQQNKQFFHVRISIK